MEPRGPHDLPLDGTPEQHAREAIALAVKLHCEAGLHPGVAMMAAQMQTGADPDAIYDLVLETAFAVIAAQASYARLVEEK